MKRISYNLGIAMTLAALAGCGKGGGSAYKPKPVEEVPPAVIAKGSETNLLPLAVGNTWVYETQSTQVTPAGSQQSSGEVTFRVTKVQEGPNGKTATIEVLNKDKVVEQMLWRVSEKGIFEVGDVRYATPGVPKPMIPTEPPLPLVVFPTEQGKVTKATINGLRPDGKVGEATYVITDEGVQEVDTNIGRMSALAVRSRTEYKNDAVNYTYNRLAWWAPDKGIVRMVLELRLTNSAGRTAVQNSLLNLKSMSP